MREITDYFSLVCRVTFHSSSDIVCHLGQAANHGKNHHPNDGWVGGIHCLTVGIYKVLIGLDGKLTTCYFFNLSDM